MTEANIQNPSNRNAQYMILQELYWVYNNLLTQALLIVFLSRHNSPGRRGDIERACDKDFNFVYYMGPRQVNIWPLSH